MDELGVSIICNAYNHEKYIRKTLEGFVCQKTTFPFEVLIHDDASTDQTAEIIREYEKQYPELIKPIYQTQNQYSQGVSITKAFQIPRVTKKYTAMCEGDDYWTDPEKLQKQVDALEKNPQVDICAHSALRVEARTEQPLSMVKPAEQDTILPAENVIMGGGEYVATNSLVYRSELDIQIPDYRQNMMFDYTLQIQGSLRGGMLYLADCMAAYRFMSGGSWTKALFSDRQKFRTTDLRVRNMLLAVDACTDHQYTETIQKRILINGISHMCTVKENALLIKQYGDAFRKLGKKQQLALAVKAYLPVINRIRYQRMLK